MQIKDYIQRVRSKYLQGNSTEHTYRGDLQSLIEFMIKDISVTNEPKRQKCGAPDYILQRKEIPLGYIEAKDIGVDLDKTEKTDQIKRYLESLTNLIVTDYLDFRFFQYGQKVKEIKLASIKNDKFFVHSENFEIFFTYIQNFCQFKGQTITSTVKLAEMMAKKAKMMKEVFFNAVLEEDEQNTLKDQFLAFKQILMHDLDEKTFADIYAQTITYGLFAARLILKSRRRRLNALIKSTSSPNAPNWTLSAKTSKTDYSESSKTWAKKSQRRSASSKAVQIRRLLKCWK